MVSAGSLEALRVPSSLDTAWEAEDKSESAGYVVQMLTWICMNAWWVDEASDGHWTDRCVLKLELSGPWLTKTAFRLLLTSCPSKVLILSGKGKRASRLFVPWDYTTDNWHKDYSAGGRHEDRQASIDPSAHVFHPSISNKLTVVLTRVGEEARLSRFKART
jgi:hypothetical protein